MRLAFSKIIETMIATILTVRVKTAVEMDE